MIEASVADTSAVISWRQSDSTTAVNLIVRNILDETDTITVDSIESPYTINGLMNCTRYSIQIWAVCGDSISDLSSRTIIETDGCCRIPSGLKVATVDDTLATIEWDDVTAADRFIFRYRQTSGEVQDWDTIITPDVVFVLQLEPCTEYEMQVKSTCGLFDTTDFAETVLIQTTGCGVCTAADYCEAGGIDASKTWIDSIRIANVIMPTGSDDGYFGYLTERTALERGRTYPFYIDPGFATEACPMFLRVWIDLDQDGTFNDSTELLLDTVDMTGDGVGGQFMLADTLPRDITRVRFAAKPRTETDTIPPSACGIFDFGEVEDYCIRVDEPCPAPETIDTVRVEEELAVLVWDKVENAFGYLYTYNEVGEEPGDQMNTSDTTVTLEDLDKCTEYVFRLISVCPQDSNGLVFRFTTKCESSVQDLEPLIADVNVFPNPFSDRLNLRITPRESLNGSINLFTSTGQLVYSERFDLFAGQEFTTGIDVDQRFVNGMYFLVLNTEQGVLTRKVVKSGY